MTMSKCVSLIKSIQKDKSKILSTNVIILFLFTDLITFLHTVSKPHLSNHSALDFYFDILLERNYSKILGKK